MVGGVTPVESAFLVVGLTNCKFLLDFIFFKTLAGALVFLLGYYFAINESRKKGSPKPLWHYLGLYFGLLLAFAGIHGPVGEVTSQMEIAGTAPDNQKTEDLVRASNLGEAEAPSLLAVSIDLSGRFFNSCIAAISQGSQFKEYNYLSNPFMLQKSLEKINNAVADGIKDERLKRDVEFFLATHYQDAKAKYEKSPEYQNWVGSEHEPLWPGAPEIQPHYTPKGAREWDMVNAEVESYVDDLAQQEIPQTSMVFGGVGVNFKGDMVKSLFIQENHTKDQKKARQSISRFNTGALDQAAMSISPLWWAFHRFRPENWTLGGAAANFTGYVASWGGQLGTEVIKDIMLGSYPYLIGYSLMFIVTLFPFTLIVCILKRNLNTLVAWTLIMIWVKSWNFCWAITDYCSVYYFQIYNAMKPGAFTIHMIPYFNNVSNIFIIMSPLVSMMVIAGSMWGIGSIATAVTLHGSKEAETTINAAKGAAGNGMTGGV